jgi:membrane protein
MSSDPDRFWGDDKMRSPFRTRQTEIRSRHSAKGRLEEERGEESGRGREADKPGDIPSAGWKDVLLRVKSRIPEHHLSIIAAGTAFYGLLASFPALTALFGLYALAFDGRQIYEHLSSLKEELSPDALRLFLALVEALAQSNRWRLGLGIGAGILFTLWGASLGIRALMSALNVTYEEREERSFVVRTALASLLTIGAICVASLVIAAVIGVPVAIQLLPLDPLLHALLVYARWPIVAAMFWLSLLVMYRYGPSRTLARWSWVSWGAFVATALWLCGSGLISWYVVNFGGYNKVYGSVGLIVILLLWFLVSAFCVLLGAEINAELERQTRKDTTVGERKPLGERGAKVADTIGKATK